MVRALDFGNHHPNPLGLPKILLADRVVRVGQLEITTQRSRAAPGTLLEIEPGRWRVATGSEDVIVGRAGQPWRRAVGCPNARLAARPSREQSAAASAGRASKGPDRSSRSDGGPGVLLASAPGALQRTAAALRTASCYAARSATHSAVTAGVAFDACAWEIWPTLHSGGTLALPPIGLSGDTAALLAWWRVQRLDVSFLITPLAEVALADGLLNGGLRHLLIGGDRLKHLPASLPPELTLVNNYGPTETTVVATSGQLFAKDPVLHVGRPISNTRIYVLGRYGSPVPLGVACSA